MITFKDKTFCASPNCKNDCGRKMTEHEKLESIIDDLPVLSAYFCGESTEIKYDNKAMIMEFKCD